MSAGAGALVRPVTSWGRLSHHPHRVTELRDRSLLELPVACADPPGGRLPGLPFGNGRSYGDVCLNPQGGLWMTGGLDRFIAFDRESGLLECEAGVLLDDIIRVALPHGWFLPVTPGTRYVSVGGAIANDVHGKNHHRQGTFGEHVRQLQLVRTDGSRRDCHAAGDADWLHATIGGMGLTGLIVTARLQLLRVPGPWLDTETLPFHSLDEFYALAQASEGAWAYSVAWIDCVHGNSHALRGLFFRANHAAHDAPPPGASRGRVPFTPPVSLINSLSLRGFNAAYFRVQRWKPARRFQHLLPFFYPLDGLRDWNRIYGPHGFYQYQAVVPRGVERDATAAMLAAIRRSGQGSFLAVLKTFGERAPAGLLSFPMAGTTLALDFPNLGPRTDALFRQLDAVVAQAGGRIYAAKDARMGRDLFRAGYPELQRFKAFRDPGIASGLSRRLIDD